MLTPKGVLLQITSKTHRAPYVGLMIIFACQLSLPNFLLYIVTLANTENRWLEKQFIGQDVGNSIRASVGSLASSIISVTP